MLKFSKCIFLFIIVTFFYSSVYSSVKSNKIISEYGKEKKTLIFLIPVKLNSFDPTESINAHTKAILPLIYESLVSVNTDRQLIPALASSWFVSSDNKFITLTIAEDHYFSDGNKVDPLDIITSLNRLCASSDTANVLLGIKGCQRSKNNKKSSPYIKLIGKNQILFQITTSPAAFLYQLAYEKAVIVKKVHSKLIGSGPYEVLKQTDDAVILKRNPYYFANRMVKNNGLIFLSANELEVPSLLEEKNIDGAIMYRKMGFKDFHNPNYKEILSNPNITEILVINNQKYPFNDSSFRKNFSNEIYNSKISECTFGAHPAYGIIPTGLGGSLSNSHNENENSPNNKSVNSLSSGYKRKKTSITIHQLNGMQNTCEIEKIIQAGKKYNMDINFKFDSNYFLLRNMYQKHTLDAFIDLYAFQNREAYVILNYFSQNGDNHANIQKNNIDILLKQALSEPSSHQRFLKYKEINQYIQDNSIVIPIYYMDHISLFNKCLTGIDSDIISNPFPSLMNLYRKTDYTN